MPNATSTNSGTARRGALPPFRLLPHESVAEYEDLFDALSAVCDPEGVYEQFCVRLLADCAWRLRRLRNAPPHAQATVACDAINRSLNLLLKSLFGRKTAKIAEVRQTVEQVIVAPYVQSSEPRPQRPYPVAYAPPRPIRRRAGSTPRLAA